MSHIVPVPKILSPTVLNYYRPVALTSCFMKCFEKLLLKFIESFLTADLILINLLIKKSVDDALAINIHEILNHSELKNSYSRILFTDFSSAFNTIIPQKLYKNMNTGSPKVCPISPKLCSILHLIVRLSCEIHL